MHWEHMVYPDVPHKKIDTGEGGASLSGIQYDKGKIDLLSYKLLISL